LYPFLKVNTVPRTTQQRILGLVELTIPPESSVIVVSNGDDSLLQLSGRRASQCHFPQDTNSASADSPSESVAAIAHLQAMCDRGAEYLLIPNTSFGWLERHAALIEYLKKIGSMVGRSTACMIFCLKRIQLLKPKSPKRVLAMLATYNEERFIDSCIQNLTSQGVEIYLLDNGSTDRTVEIAQDWLGRGLIGIENLPREGVFSLEPQLMRKEELASTLEADWFMHVDADEIHLAPYAGWTLAEAFAAVENAGYNAVNFQEFTFIPTLESPDHDHPGYQDTMRWYYPYQPQTPFGIRAWLRQYRITLAASGGHKTRFPGIRLCPVFFPMKHYQFLSVTHGLRKYADRKYDPKELQAGWHGAQLGWRRFLKSEFSLPPEGQLHEFFSDDKLDPSQPWTGHFFQLAMQGKTPNQGPSKNHQT
jgi:hypothetical protein